MKDYLKIEDSYFLKSKVADIHIYFFKKIKSKSAVKRDATYLLNMYLLKKKVNKDFYRQLFKKYNIRTIRYFMNSNIINIRDPQFLDSINKGFSVYKNQTLKQNSFIQNGSLLSDNIVII